MATASAQVAVLGAIARAGVEMDSARRRKRRLDADTVAVQMPIVLIDSLLSDLEALNLADCQRIPDSLAPSLSWLLDHSPVESPELTIGISPADLMDMLFELQESLFALKGGDFRRRLQMEDERGSHSRSSLENTGFVSDPRRCNQIS